jgi:hypothetical protein
MTNLPVWQREYKAREEYEIARLEFMVKLTERAMGPNPMPSQDFLVKQKARLEHEIEQLKLKLTSDPDYSKVSHGRNSKSIKKTKKKAAKKSRR